MRTRAFRQTLGSTAALGQGVWVFGSVNALETSDPVREATRVGGEAGLSYRTAKVQLQGAGGARRLTPEVAPPRTAATYRARASYRPVSLLGFSLGYSRQPFDEIAALIEQGLDIESLDAGVDVKPTTTLTLYGGAGAACITRRKQPHQLLGRSESEGCTQVRGGSIRPNAELRGARSRILFTGPFLLDRGNGWLFPRIGKLGSQFEWRTWRPADRRGRSSAIRVAPRGPDWAAMGEWQPNRGVRTGDQQCCQQHNRSLPL